jgi:hypothetical protein
MALIVLDSSRRIRCSLPEACLAPALLAASSEDVCPVLGISCATLAFLPGRMCQIRLGLLILLDDLHQPDSSCGRQDALHPRDDCSVSPHLPQGHPGKSPHGGPLGDCRLIPVSGPFEAHSPGLSARRLGCRFRSSACLQSGPVYCILSLSPGHCPAPLVWQNIATLARLFRC